MASSMNITQNDTAPSAAGTLREKVTGLAVDIQSATVEFHMRNSVGVMKVDAAADNDQVGDGSDGTKGNVSYDWVTGDTDTVGIYAQHWEVTYADGTIRTFPTPGKNTVIIGGELA